jgi:DNA-binding MarR family transcriptional regulator
MYWPEQFKDLPCSARLVWFHIWAEGEGEYPIRKLAEELEMSPVVVNRAIRTLVERGLLGGGASPCWIQSRGLPG